MLPWVGGKNHQNMGGLLLSEHYGKTLWFARKLRTVFKHYSSTSSNTCAGPVTANPKTLNPKALNLKTLKPLTLKTLNPKPEKQLRIRSMFCNLSYQCVTKSGILHVAVRAWFAGWYPHYGLVNPPSNFAQTITKPCSSTTCFTGLV